jgi:hypothetical protein
MQETLQETHDDFRDMLANCRRCDEQWNVQILHETMEAQTEEARASKETSKKIGTLTQVAFIFLPLQLTTSLLGMNLQAFGNGSVQTSTFVGLAVDIIFCSMVPVLWMPSGEILHFIHIARCLLEAAAIYGLFWLFHPRALTNELWNLGLHCGIARRFDQVLP